MAIAAGAQLIGGIFKGIQGRKQQKMANAIKPVNAVYKESPYAQNQLSAVQQMMGGRMAGAGAAEQNIMGNMANSMAGVSRNSTNSSQSLAMLAGLQGNTNQAFSDLQTKENMNAQSLLGQLGYANQGMTREKQMVYEDQLRNYNNDMQAKNALQGAAWQNKGGMVSDFQNAAIGAASATGGGGGGGGFSFADWFGGGAKNKTQLIGSGVPGGGYGGAEAQNTQGYIDPRRQNPQMLYKNPFVNN